MLIMDEYATPPAKPKKLSRYLGRVEVAEYLGLKSVRSLSRIKMPEPDALIGTHRGWLPETIDDWNAARPGRGRWGAR
jgi:hypothetical protein